MSGRAICPSSVLDRESTVTIGYATAMLDMRGVYADEVHGRELVFHFRLWSIPCACATARQWSRRDVSSRHSGAGFELREPLAALHLLTD